MLSYINIRKIWIIFLKMIILEYIKDCFKSIHVAYLCYFSYKFTYIIVMFSFLTQTGWEWEKRDTEAHMRIKYLLSCFVSALLRRLISASLHFMCQTRTQRPGPDVLLLFAVELSALSWAFTTISQLRYTLTSDLLRLLYSGQTEIPLWENEECETAPRWCLWFLLQFWITFFLLCNTE